ncbi:MAG: hypothetical protein AAF449_07070 [Myxococcota bacterium]
MSSVRLLTVAAASLLTGGALGSYATSALLGGAAEQVRPAPPPPVAECKCDPQAPPPVDPLAGRGITEGLTEIEGGAPADRQGQGVLPGLPPSALNRARSEAQRLLTPCAASPDALGEGTLVLELTVTATGGVGFIKQAQVVDLSGDAEWARSCVMDQVRRVRFDWSGADGQQTLKLPLRVGI